MTQRLLTFIFIGGLIGSMMGYFGKCSTGTCPLTATPLRGALYGAFWGLLLSLTISPPIPKESVPESKNVIKIIDSESFNKEVLKVLDIPVLVDFYAPWCGPCRRLSPIISSLADKLNGKSKVCKLNTDDVGDVSKQYKIRTIPLVIVFYDGKEVERVRGCKSEKYYIELLKKYYIEQKESDSVLNNDKQEEE